MRRVTFILTTLFFAFTLQLSAKSSSVSLIDLSSKLNHSLPGDTLLIEPGIYKDIKIEIKAFGTKDNPIVIRCSKPGEVIITGQSSLKVAGEWVEIDGLYFRDGTPPAGSSVIEYRLGDDAANNCRVTNCVVDSFNPSGREIQYSYVLLFGRNNRFDHNSLLNKLNLGVTLIVMLNQERDQQNFHRI